MVAHYDKNKRKNGIICDICGDVHIDKFKYYSVEAAHVEVDRDVGTRGVKDVDEKYLNLDLCETCWKNIEDQVRENLEKINSQGAWSTSTKAITNKQKMRD